VGALRILVHAPSEHAAVCHQSSTGGAIRGAMIAAPGVERWTFLRRSPENSGG
jgi:hypothetical protein